MCVCWCIEETGTQGAEEPERFPAKVTREDGGRVSVKLRLEEGVSEQDI